ncbi:hypothetical protein ACHAXT_011593 [Thalassiosira profunda]
MACSSPPPTGINGRPAAISPRQLNSYQQRDPLHAAPSAGMLSFLSCTGGDYPIFICDGAPKHNEVDFDVNPTGVYVAVHTHQWQLAVERVKIYPREASTWVVRYGSPLEHNGGASGSGDGAKYSDQMAVASPTNGGNPPPPPVQAPLSPGSKKEVLVALLKAYPAGISAHDDQGCLPLHLAFRTGVSEEIILMLLEAYPEAIERPDHKGRLPSQMAPKHAQSYGDTIGEAFARGPEYYYWASRVATADRVRSEVALTKQIKMLEERGKQGREEAKKMLDKTERELTEEIEYLSVENVELKERLTWYETKYDGADEKEKVLVDHTNSLAERLRLTSLSEEHLATKLATLEGVLKTKEAEVEAEGKTAAAEKEALEARTKELEAALEQARQKSEGLAEAVEARARENDEAKARFEKERALFEKQIDASKECLMELIASSKEDKRMFDEDSRALRQQLSMLQGDVQRASQDERRMFETESDDLRKQMAQLQGEVHRVASSGGESRHSHRGTDPAEMSAYVSKKRLEATPEEEEAPFDTYVSQSMVPADESRDESEVFDGLSRGFSHESDVDAALALGELTDEQRMALEELDLGGTREEIAAMLGRVPGLTRNQVNLLVDVASSLVA